MDGPTGQQAASQHWRSHDNDAQPAPQRLRHKLVVDDDDDGHDNSDHGGDARLSTTSTTPLHCGLQQHNVAFDGDDIVEVMSGGFAQCCAACANTSGCTALSFCGPNHPICGSPAHPVDCYLKSGAVRFACAMRASVSSPASCIALVPLSCVDVSPFFVYLPLLSAAVARRTTRTRTASAGGNNDTEATALPCPALPCTVPQSNPGALPDWTSAVMTSAPVPAPAPPPAPETHRTRFFNLLEADEAATLARLPDKGSGYLTTCVRGVASRRLPLGACAIVACLVRVSTD